MSIKGIGGIFFRSENPKELMHWYRENLGFPKDDWGQSFNWSESKEKDNYATVWSPFKKDSDHIPSDKQFMINFIVDDLDAFKLELTAKNIAIIGSEESDYGKFCWINDPEGNKLELWQPA